MKRFIEGTNRSQCLLLPEILDAILLHRKLNLRYPIKLLAFLFDFLLPQLICSSAGEQRRMPNISSAGIG